jgi:predicted sulfurtransferase
MRNILALMLMMIIGGVILTACNSAEQKNRSIVSGAKPAAAPVVNADGVRRITPVELQSMLANNEAIVLDVRNAEAYNTAHVRGARLIPEAEVVNHISEYPKDKLIVTYCS